MLISAAMTTTSLNLTDCYRLNQSRLADSMLRVASGKRFQSPADSISDYFRAKQFKADIKGQQQVQRELSVGAALLDTAKEVGGTVFEDLTKMQELMKNYYDANSTEDERAVNKAEFNAIKNRIADTIENTYYGEWKVVQDNGMTPLLSIVLDPRDISMTYDISYDTDDVTDATGLTLGIFDQATEEAALQGELDHAASYLAKSVVYSDAVMAHRDMISNKSIRYQESIDNTEKNDDGAEMMNLVRLSINQQMTVSMLAQANMFRSGIAALVSAK
jgi:flagellin-like hook-associated protein FlgL